MRVLVSYDDDTGTIGRVAMSSNDILPSMAGESDTAEVPSPRVWCVMFGYDEDPISLIPTLCEMNPDRNDIQLIEA